ncbi:hypothetical protein SAY86_020832 [Trapa natans]|uniref:Uncharacterized protein n=1 Tax=Trapa natans TaxID=22666 RepID=A0AAN7RF82_TRANT|nr:hypothetical protein SAY86_020832 [Trapa natans]
MSSTLQVKREWVYSLKGTALVFSSSSTLSHSVALSVLKLSPPSTGGSLSKTPTNYLVQDTPIHNGQHMLIIVSDAGIP